MVWWWWCFFCLGKTMGGEKVMLSFFWCGWVGGSSVGLLVFIDWHWCSIIFLLGRVLCLYYRFPVNSGFLFDLVNMFALQFMRFNVLIR